MTLLFVVQVENIISTISSTHEENDSGKANNSIRYRLHSKTHREEVKHTQFLNHKVEQNIWVILTKQPISTYDIKIIFKSLKLCLRLWLLLSLVESWNWNIRNLDNLVPNSRNISYSMTLTTKSRNKELVLQTLTKDDSTFHKTNPRLVNWSQHNLLSILDKLYSSTLTDHRVRLLNLDSVAYSNTKTHASTPLSTLKLSR